METVDLVKLITENGAVVAIAVFAVFLLNRVWEARHKDAQQYSEQIKSLYNEVTQALKSNTEAITRLTAIVESMYNNK